MQIFNDRLFVEMYSEHEGHLHGFRRVLVTGQTTYQQVEIVDTHAYGRCLLLDGKMQSSQVDEHIYHELLVHPAMITHPRPRSVLILGGGEGATAREVLRHASVERVDMLEIDEQVVTFAKRHLADWHRGAFEDPRLRLIFSDGRRYVENTQERYDLIFIDVSDPGYDGPAYLLYTLQFYQAAARCLLPDGLIVMQAGPSTPTCGEIMASIYRTLASVFSVVSAYEAFIPSFGYPWGFCLGSRRWDPRHLRQDEVDRRLRNRGILDLKAYDGQTHYGLFILSKTLRTMLATQGRLIEDQQPIYTPL
jgi:spermidine synthase